MSGLERILEGLLFLSAEPQPVSVLAEAAQCSDHEAAGALARLRDACEFDRRGVVVRELAGGWALATHPDCEPAARRLLGRARTPPLTPAQAETLAVIAYLQPVSRPEVSRIRGVNAESATASLLEHGLVEEAGRSRFGAVLYRTTALFLRLFGLGSLADLPDPSRWDPTPEVEGDLRERLAARLGGPPAAGSG